MRQTISDSGLEEQLRDVRAAALWGAVVGEEIAGQCGKPWVSHGILNVSVRNASLRQELSMTRSLLTKAINGNFREPVIKDIRFISGS